MLPLPPAAAGSRLPMGTEPPHGCRGPKPRHEGCQAFPGDQPGCFPSSPQTDTLAAPPQTAPALRHACFEAGSPQTHPTPSPLVELPRKGPRAMLGMWVLLPSRTGRPPSAAETPNTRLEVATWVPDTAQGALATGPGAPAERWELQRNVVPGSS